MVGTSELSRISGCEKHRELAEFIREWLDDNRVAKALSSIRMQNIDCSRSEIERLRQTFLL